MIEPAGMIWVGRDDRDLMWSEIDWDYLKSLPTITPKIPYVDQSNAVSNWIYWMACTMMQEYVAILSILWGNENEEEKRAILDMWIRYWYVIWKWWLTQSWVKATVKCWNERHPNDQMMYLKCEVWDPVYELLFNKWYPVSTSRKLNSSYSKDKKDDCIVQGTRYSAWTRWHASCRMKWDRDDCEWKHTNTYPNYICNEFHVNSLTKLVDTWLYSKNVYITVPVKWAVRDELVKRKLVKVAMLLANKIKEISSSSNTIKVVDTFVKYFKDNWF